MVEGIEKRECFLKTVVLKEVVGGGGAKKKKNKGSGGFYENGKTDCFFQ